MVATPSGRSKEGLNLAMTISGLHQALTHSTDCPRIYGKQNEIQRMISPVLMNKIPQNLVSMEVPWVLTPNKVFVKFAPPEPPFFNTWKNLHLDDIVSWQPHLSLVLWDEFCLVFFLFFGLPCSLARPLMYIYIFIYVCILVAWQGHRGGQKKKKH